MAEEKKKRKPGRPPGKHSKAPRRNKTPMSEMRALVDREDFPQRAPEDFVATLRTMEDTDFLHFMCDVMLTEKTPDDLAEEKGAQIQSIVRFYRKKATKFVSTLRIVEESRKPIPKSFIRQSEERGSDALEPIHPVCEYLFGPGQDASRALAQCEEVLMTLDVFNNFQKLMTIQNKRLRSLLIRQSQGDKIREKDITDVINSMRQIVLDIARLQLELDVIQTYADKLKISVQNTMINFNDTMDIETRKGIGTLSNFMVGFFQKQASIAAKHPKPKEAKPQDGEVIEGELIEPA